MACVRALQEISTKLGHRLRYSQRCKASQLHYISSRQISLSAFLSKSPNRNFGNKENENDLDFYGLHDSESDTRSRDAPSKISTDDKQLINKLLENYSLRSGSNHTQFLTKPFGLVRYDKSMKLPVEATEGDAKPAKLHRTRNKKNLSSDKQYYDDYGVHENFTSSKNDRRDKFLTGEISEELDKQTDIGEKNKRAVRENRIKRSLDKKEKSDQKIDKTLSYVDEQYFCSHDVYEGLEELQDKFLREEISKRNARNTDSYINKQCDKVSLDEKDLSFVDEQYFSHDSRLQDKNTDIREARGNTTFISDTEINFDPNQSCQRGTNGAKLRKRTNIFNNSDSLDVTANETNEQDMPFIDSQYFSTQGQLDGVPHTNQSRFPITYDRRVPNSSENIFVDDTTVSKTTKQRKQTQRSKEAHSEVREETPFQKENLRRRKFQDGEPDLTEKLHVQPTKGRESRDTTNVRAVQSKEKQMGQEKQTAYEASMELRAKLEHQRGANLTGKSKPTEVDSKGFRLLKNQVPHFENMPSIDVIKILRNSIIYDENDILAINKPYGLTSQEGPGVFHSVTSFLDQIVPKTQLFPVHRLDKETTGVMMFAKTEEMADRLKKCFYKREVIKKYLVATKNVPELKSGVVDIPITEGTVEAKFRMCLRPYHSPELAEITKRRQDGTEAMTKYSVIAMGDKCAVLECIPITGKKHQIRVHLAFALNCPVLGDHKYSHFDKLAPMKLHPDMLQKLKIQQSKVRYMAMHLHARSITIPEFLNGRNLFIRAQLPHFFVQNLKDLKLQLPPHS